MYKRNFIAAFLIVFMLGLFFQYNRTDGFMKLSTNIHENFGMNGTLVEGSGADRAMERETFLILYDPVNLRSMFLKHYLERFLREQKKATLAAEIGVVPVIDRRYMGVLVATGNIGGIAALPQLEQYVADGGTALFLDGLSDVELPADFIERIGVHRFGESYTREGIHLTSDIIFGVQSLGVSGRAYQTTTAAVSLVPEARIHAAADDGTPLVWEMPAGAGKYVVYNGRRMADKPNVGLLAGMLSLSSDAYIYPTVGAKVFIIDDFPAPVPEGIFPRLYDEVHLTTADFYRNVWWPQMLANAKRYGFKYTGVVIETYGNQVKGPFAPMSDRYTRSYLIAYGRELLKSGGELGIHGYNHQPLAPAGYNQEHLDYTPWASPEDMKESLRELRRYIASAYPDYTIRTYVPPSNILSPEGKAALKEVFPDLNNISSLYTGLPEDRAYYQDFQRNPDGTFELPRVSSGYVVHEDMLWEIVSVINYIGIVSHFVHPDEIFYEESANTTWAEMNKGMDAFMKFTKEKYGWLQGVTSSEEAAMLGAYFDLDCRIERDGDEMTVVSWNYRTPPRYILRTHRRVTALAGCTVSAIGSGAYLVETKEPTARLRFE
jgi:hypothetical protein